jgi:hypothetical protein
MKRRTVVHPFFFAVFPFLALYAYNIRSLPVAPGEVAGPLALSLGCAGALFFIFRVLFKDPAKAGLLVSLIVLWFLSFGRIAGLISVWTEGLFNRSLFFATAILVGFLAFLIVRSRRDLGGLTRVLNVVSAVLVLFNAASIALTVARRPPPVLNEEVRSSLQVKARPNIYYLVFDAYTRADILQEVFGHDNAPFISALKSRGFFVASKSYANYGFTYHSLASALNFTYLDEVARDAGGTSLNQEPLYRMIRENRAMAFLKSLGYKLFCFSTSFGPGEIKNVDRSLGFKGSTSEFRPVLLGLTPLPLFLRPAAADSQYAAHRAHILDAFRVLEESPLQQGPFFFFLHLMSPHPPFVFGPNGEPVEPPYPFSTLDGNRMPAAGRAAIQDYLVRYRNQLAFINKRIIEAIDAILSRSPEPPIIILQGDHGSRAYADFDHPEASYLKENLAILNAYFLPGDGPTGVYPEISPVNTFRLIFKRYFGAGLNLLEDRSAWCTWRRPYVFIPFSEKTYMGTLASIRAKMKPKTPTVQER